MQKLQFHLVQPRQDSATVETLQRLLDEALAGRVIGLAYVALHTQDEYSGHVVGQVLESPLLARGICRALEDTISKK
jgi:hypothetical protein